MSIKKLLIFIKKEKKLIYLLKVILIQNIKLILFYNLKKNI